MKKYYKYFFVLVTASMVSLPALAEGSVSYLNDVLPLIKERAVFEKFISNTFQITDSGFGVRLGNQAMPHLGGARTGPYKFEAIWHSINGDIPVTLTVNTDIVFFDKKGNLINNGQLKKAFKLKEKFSSIEIE